MAGLIDVGILKPELAGSFAAGYRGAEQTRQQTAQAEQQLARGRQQMQMDDMTMKRLQEDREMMLQLQQRLKAAGQDPDLDKVFDALISSGNPDLVLKGTEGKQRLRDQREFARVQGLGIPGAAAPTGAAAPSAPEGELVAPPIAPPTGTMRDIAPGGAVGPETDLSYLKRTLGTPGAPAAVNTLAPAAAPVTNAILAPAAQPAAPSAANAMVGGLNPQLIAQTQSRINSLMQFAATASTPQIAQNAMAQARILQDQLELYSRRETAATPQIKEIGVTTKTNEPVYFDARTNEQFTIGTDPSGKQVRKPYTGGVNRATSTVTATATSSTPAAKSLAGPVGARAETSLAKAEGAAGIMESANMVREALNTGNVIAGPLAGPRTKLAQVLELAGAGDKEKLVATRTAIQGLATLTLESRAELKGQGQVTENEQKLLERARSAEIGELTIAELQQVVNVSQRLANRMWSSHQNLLKTMRTDPNAADSLRYYEPNMSLPQAIGEGKPKAETDKRKQRLVNILDPQQQQR